MPIWVFQCSGQLEEALLDLRKPGQVECGRMADCPGSARLLPEPLALNAVLAFVGAPPKPAEL